LVEALAWGFDFSTLDKACDFRSLASIVGLFDEDGGNEVALPPLEFPLPRLSRSPPAFGVDVELWVAFS